ncbi:hypothetical protein AVEN_153849-1 [Araneus ventricosus]|uniref:Gustatory receptor n=1 Tax=Araneus ventricosus TaxID=182803 RepID=A0A4Y2N1W7_ARAVE|nr:hypothetical protein AVEN_153849-1 [Araneus ventricosus]
MRNLITENSVQGTLFARKSNANPASRLLCGALHILLKIYDISIGDDSSVIYKILSKIHILLMHLSAIYLLAVAVPMHLHSSEASEVTFGFAVAGMFPLALHYAVKFKKHLVNHILKRFFRIEGMQGICIKTRDIRWMNFIVIIILLIPVFGAIVTVITLVDDNPLTLYFSFFIDFKNKVIGTSIQFCIIQILFGYTYTYPCIIALMCGAIYYEISEFLYYFQKRLNNESLSLSKNRVLAIMETHTFFFEVAHELLTATSVICFFLLCTQTTIMYCSLAMFVLTHKGDLTPPQIVENCLVITLMPISIFGIVFCASRISRMCQNVQLTLLRLRDGLSRQFIHDKYVIHFLNLMIEKKFPVMSAFGLGELTPNFVLNMFGSLFTYSLLILNLKK